MDNQVKFIVSLIVVYALYSSLLGVMVWGWVRWMRRKQARTVSSVLSLLGLALATASVVAAVASVWYGHYIGYDFSHPNPPLLHFIDWAGALLALAATAAAAGGLRRPSSVRWHSLVVALGILVLWVLTGLG
jgi:hypothetical protein